MKFGFYIEAILWTGLVVAFLGAIPLFGWIGWLLNAAQMACKSAWPWSLSILFLWAAWFAWHWSKK